jgi:hypothetical protein
MIPPIIPGQFWAAWTAVENAWRFAQGALTPALAAELQFQHWIGYGFGGTLDNPTIALFLKPQADTTGILNFVQGRLDGLGSPVRLAPVAIDKFAAHPGRRRPPLAGGVCRPGHGVEAVSSLQGSACTAADIGTIGAILTASNAPNDRWILSNHHVLARRHDCRFDAHGQPRGFKTVLTPGDNKIADPGAALADLQTVEIRQSANPVDACAVRLLDPHSVVVDYSPLVLANPAVPLRPNPGDGVEKFGCVSHRTTGTVRFSSATVKIDLESSGFSGAELTDQILVSLDDGTGHSFFQPGDSGSLVVHQESHRPVGILVGGGTREGDTAQLTVVSPLETIFQCIHPPPGGEFAIAV